MKYLFLLMIFSSFGAFANDKEASGPVIEAGSEVDQEKALNMLQTLEKGRAYQEEQQKALDELEQDE